MSTAALPKKILGPHKLPHLLSILPKSGRQAIVRPINENPQIFYLVTRSKLKFTSKLPAEPSSTGESSKTVAGAKVGGLQENKMKKYVASNPIEGGIVKAHGKAWGMKFYADKYQSPRVKTKKADPEIRPGKTSWVALDPETLSAEAQKAIECFTDIQKQHDENKERILKARKAIWKQRHKERKEERLAALKRVREAREESLKVEIVY